MKTLSLHLYLIDVTDKHFAASNLDNFDFSFNRDLRYEI